MLNSKALYFCRLDCLGDPFEGAKGSKALEERYDEYYLNFLREASRTLPPGEEPMARDEAQIEAMARGGLRSLRSAGEWQRRTLFVNCWHEAPHESEAMWRLYAGWKLAIDGAPGGVVIQSTAGQLAEQVKKSRSVHVGRVRYIDYSKTLVGINEAPWTNTNRLNE